MTITSTMMDDAVRRINCYAAGSWLEQILSAAGLMPLNIPGASGLVSLPRASGLVFRIGSVGASAQFTHPVDPLFLARLEGDATAPMPLGLDARTETPAAASAKLSRDTIGAPAKGTAAGDTRVSFFMAGGRVIELRFNADLIGFDRILVARLGEPLDWRDPANR